MLHSSIFTLSFRFGSFCDFDLAFEFFDIFEALSLEISIIGFFLLKSTLGFLKVIGESDVVSKKSL